MTSPSELVQSLLQTPTSPTFVSRKLLIQTIGIEQAEKFLPPLPEQIGVNVEQLLAIIELKHPELYKEAQDAITD
jgi:hypothetical protein